MSQSTPLYTQDELIQLLKRPEGLRLEFKSLWDRSEGSRKTLDRGEVRTMIAEVTAAMANADGGTLILGVDDDGTPSGHAYPGEAVAEFFAVPERRLTPPVRCQTDRVRVDGHELLVIEVAMTAEAVMVVGNGFPFRVGSSTLREPQAAINARKQSYVRVGYEQRIRPDATLDDLDLGLAAEFLRRTVVGDRPVQELLERFGLIEPRRGGPAITNAALLLFAKEPVGRWHPRFGLRFFRVEGTEREHGTARNVTQLPRIELPIAAGLPEALRFVSTQVRKSEKLHDLFFRETPEYPEFAWQEAIVNAVAHRDYEVQGQEIEVWFYSDRMEVKSPGTLISPVTIEGLKERKSLHASRNPRIVGVLVATRIMREEGEGIPRIFDEMQRSFLREPLFALEFGQFLVTLRNTPIFEGPSPEWAWIVAGLNLTTPGRRVMLACPGGFTSADYQELNQVDRDVAYREIQELVAAHLVSSPGHPGRSARYQIAPTLRERRIFLEKRTPKLRSFFRSREVLTNRDYCLLFGVARPVATRELSRLAGEGYLVREGERRGTFYRPRQDLLPPAGKETG